MKCSNNTVALRTWPAKSTATHVMIRTACRATARIGAIANKNEAFDVLLDVMVQLLNSKVQTRRG